ncbi:MAG: ATP synthase F0 subunit B [Bryobacteraceae bacterium]|jgi:F-type H+-transporting ATPase subunit b
MRRFGGLILLAGLMAWAPAHAAGPGEADNLTGWKWANFVVLAGALGYVIGKNAGPFFAARSQQIRKDMVEAGEQRKEADERVAEVERRLADLGSEIAALRAEAQTEAQAETSRMSQQTTLEMGKIQAQAEQEIAAAAKAARTELKRYAAQLAVGQAEGKIRARMTPAIEDALVAGFVRDLDYPSPKVRTFLK